MKDFILRKWKREDAAELAVAADNPKIAANLRNTFPYPYLPKDAEWYINDCISKEGRNQLTRAIVADGIVIGSIGIFVKEDVYEKSAELGYWLSEDYWGLEIMSRSVQMICKEAFTAFDIVRIFAEPFDYNVGSRRVLEKSGFTCEGIMRDGIYKNGKVFSYYMYSILREEVSVM